MGAQTMQPKKTMLDISGGLEAEKELEYGSEPNEYFGTSVDCWNSKETLRWDLSNRNPGNSLPFKITHLNSGFDGSFADETPIFWWR